MSREIKFRAWHQEGLSKPEDNKCSMTYWKLGQGLDNSWFYTHAKAVMQYTGLKDKNGVEIYEGDIVAIYPHMAIEYKLEEANICEVKWSEEQAGWVGVFANIKPWARHEVIGNIYENPELLKEAK